MQRQFLLKSNIKPSNVQHFVLEEIPENKRELGFNKEYSNAKNKLDSINIKVWNQARKYTNNFEFPLKKDINKADYPVSRSFFKMWEMLYEFDFSVSNGVLCIGEAPGGFVQAISKFDNKCLIKTMSLVDNSNNSVPKYSNIITTNKNVEILNGADSTGNIYMKRNVKFISRHTKKKYDLITADGGFNEENRFNIKEQLHYKLFFSEVLIAILNQSFNGTFVLKMFDFYTDFSVDLLIILSFFYSDILFYKPLTSRPTNSEKYIICSAFKKSTETGKKIKIKLLNLLEEISEKSFRLLNIEVDDEYTKMLKEINSFFTEHQIDSINSNIDIINNNCKNGVFQNPPINRNNERNNWLRKYGLS